MRKADFPFEKMWVLGLKRTLHLSNINGATYWMMLIAQKTVLFVCLSCIEVQTKEWLAGR